MTVSVLIPAYNAARTIRATLDALVNQTRPADEILVCDDGSTDETAAIAASYPGVRVVPQPHGGLSVARNTLLDAATGDIVMFSDADDLPHPDWIAHLAGRLEATGADLSTAALRAGRHFHEPRSTWPCEAESVIDGRDYYRLHLRHPPGLCSYLPTLAMRREMLFRGRPVRGVVGLHACEDDAFLLQVARKCRTVAVSPKCVYDYVFRDDSICGAYMRGRSDAAWVHYQYYLRDRSRFTTSRSPRYFLKAAKSLVRAWFRHLVRHEPLHR